MSVALTANGGIYAQSSDMQHILCYLDDGRLLVSKSHVHDPRVSSFKAYLARKNEQIAFLPVEMQVIADAYQQSSGTTTKESASKTQQSASELFQRAVESHASDIHIRVSKKSRTTILFRIHNDLSLQMEESFEYGEKLCAAIYQTMCDVSDATFNPLGRQDARISDPKRIPAKLDGIRIATAPTVDGNVMVLRLLYNDANGGEIKALGYADDHVAAFSMMRRRPTGINIIAGPTGSGKSTTQTRLLTTYINDTKRRKHVITVEDPPEYPIEWAVQTPVKDAETEEERSLEFQRAIASAMRLDPDVIMIGEIRDSASATLALRAAMTGHQVWSTLHANHALSILDRLRDLGIPLALLADPTIITGLICQRLVKTLCPYCKAPFTNDSREYKESDIDRVLSAVRRTENLCLAGKGCKHCSGSGTTGRTAIAEIIIPDETLMRFIKNEDRVGAHNYWRTEQKGRSMLAHAITKVEMGLVDPFMAEDAVGPLIMDAIQADYRISHDEVESFK